LGVRRDRETSLAVTNTANDCNAADHIFGVAGHRSTGKDKPAFLDPVEFEPAELDPTEK